jgi:hypothetical protein
LKAKNQDRFFTQQNKRTIQKFESDSESGEMIDTHRQAIVQETRPSIIKVEKAPQTEIN